MYKILLVALFLFLPSIAYSLDDSEYYALLNRSLEFRLADQELNQLWKDISSFAKKNSNHRKELIKEQREWAKNGRDKLANEFMSKGIDKDLAYTKAVIYRLNELQSDLYNLTLSEEAIDKGLIKTSEAFLMDNDDPDYYNDNSTNRNDIIKSFCNRAYFEKNHPFCK